MIGLFAASFVLIITTVSCCSSDKYVISNDELSWIQALINCRKNGMELVIINSREEEQAIEELVRDCEPKSGYKKGFWISLSKPGLDPHNDWHWFGTGKKLNDSTYVNWAPGKPDNPAAKCAEITIKNRKFVWNNLMCDRNHTRLRYICQDSDC